MKHKLYNHRLFCEYLLNEPVIILTAVFKKLIKLIFFLFENSLKSVSFSKSFKSYLNVLLNFKPKILQH